MPVGGVIMWSGLISNIPERWALCDGKNGTPDLRNRFVVGAGGDYAIGSSGEKRGCFNNKTNAISYA